MTDAQQGNPVGEIKIMISETAVQWDTGHFSLPDMLFWMDVVKEMILKQVVGDTTVTAVSPNAAT